MTRADYYKLWDSSSDCCDLQDVTPKEMVADFEEDFIQFLRSDKIADKLLDVVCMQKDKMIENAIQSTLILGKLVHVDTFFDEEVYNYQVVQNERDIQEELDFVRIESASYNFM